MLSIWRLVAVGTVLGVLGFAASESATRARQLEKSGDSSDRWLRRLLEFEDEERQESLVQGDPKQKAMQARAALSQIFEKGEVMAAIGTEIVGEVGTKQSVLVPAFIFFWR